MVSVGVRELKNRLSEYPRRVRRGEEITEMVERARRPFPREPLRTLDAIHVATALAIRSLVTELRFLSLDQRIRRNAIELGFEVVPDEGVSVA